MSFKTFAPILRLLLTLLLFLCATGARAQRIDLNANGMSDVWETIYGTNGVNPNVDSDGDGIANLQEATAGTSPYNAGSVPKLSLLGLTSTNGNLFMAAELGKLYQLQSLTNLGSTNWLTETSQVVRAGTSFSFPSPVTCPRFGARESSG